MNPSEPIALFFKAREEEFDEILTRRKAKLTDLAAKIRSHLHDQDQCDLIVICTHNSRRSQLAELILRKAADFYGVKNLYSYSGGTETTAFNSRMVWALEQSGFHFNKEDDPINPNYRLSENNGKLGQKMFSKKYAVSFNPQKDFIAIMVCEQADKNCPIVFGATDKISLPYQDPKQFDQRPNEEKAYLDKVFEIGREMTYLVKSI